MNAGLSTQVYVVPEIFPLYLVASPRVRNTLSFFEHHLAYKQLFNKYVLLVMLYKSPKA